MEKEAKELYDGFLSITKNHNQSKKCAVIFCNGMVGTVLKYFDKDYPDYAYWVGVRSIVYNINHQ